MRLRYGFIVSLIFVVILFFAYGRISREGEPVEQMSENTLPPKKLKLLFWGTPVDNPVMEIFQQACQDFAAVNPSVDLELNFYSVEQYKSKLPALMAANRTPDIFMTWCGAFLETFVRAGKVLPLDQFLTEDPQWSGTFLKNVFDLMTYDGKVYGIPTARAVAALFYNQDIFDRLGLEKPSNQTEFKETVKVLRREGIIPLAFGNKEPWVGGMMAGQILQRIGKKNLLNSVKNGTIPWTHPAFIKSGEIIQELIQAGAFPERPNAIGYQDTINLFHKGNAGMMLMGSWFIQYLISQDQLPNNTIGVMKFPSFDAKIGSANDWMGQTDMNLAISARCEQKQTAVKLIKWITRPQYQRDFMQKAGLLPATNITMDNENVCPQLLSLIRLQKKMTSLSIFPDIGLSGLAGQEFNKSIQMIFAGRKPEAVFKQLQKKLDSGKL